MEKIYVDAEGCQRGRLGSYVAKQALLGYELIVVNCEKAIVSGREPRTITDFRFKKAINVMNPEKGPFYSRSPEKMMKRTIRGMVPDFRLGRGKVAMSHVKCYIGIPDEFKKEKFIKIPCKTPFSSITLKKLGKLV